MELSDDHVLQSNPRERANFISKLLFWYSIPIFKNSLKKTFSGSDLYKPLEEHKAEYLGNKLYKVWKAEIASLKKVKLDEGNRRTGQYTILLRCIIKVFGTLIISLGLCLFCLDFCFKLTQPIFLGLLVSHYSGVTNTSSIYFYAMAVIFCTVFNVVFTHTYMLSQSHGGMKLRIALMGMVYRKVLKLSKESLRDTESGTILNLLTSDVAKIEYSLVSLHQLWLGPLETVAVFLLVYYHIGLSAAAGTFVLVLFFPAQVYVGRRMANLRRNIANCSDIRIRLMKEIIRGVRVIKMYVWEKPFGKLIAAAREKEMNVIRRSNMLRSFNLSCMMFTSRVAIFTSLVVYALLGQIVTAEKAFVITAYYNILRQVMMVQFPRGIEQLGETLTSLERIQNFMVLKEKNQNSTNQETNASDLEPTSSTSLLASNMDESYPKTALKLIKVQAKWNTKTDEYTLDDISLSINPGEHVALIGQVGCGKSSILQVILGDIAVISGKVELPQKKLSYYSQEPWIFNGTVQQNILFGEPFESDRYENVIKACALLEDVKLWPNGDETLVGDHGEALSGGQKARVSLARVVYRKADIYLLDDPLSAVDVIVRKYLVDNCIHGFLQGCIVVLATHQVHFLEKMDQIIILEHGKVNKIINTSQHVPHSIELRDFLGISATELEKHNDEKTAQALPVEEQPVKSQVSGKGLVETSKTTQSQESRQSNAVGIQHYLKYIHLGGGYLLFSIAMLFCAGTQFFASGSDYFLAYWVNHESMIERTALNKTETFSINQTGHGNTREDQMLPIYVFTTLTLGTIIVTLVRTGLLFEIATKASKQLHSIMYDGIINASLYFFANNPAGRIINRFSKDMNMVDDIMPQVIIEVIQIAMALIGVIVVVAIVNPWSLLPTILVGVLFFFLRRIYLACSRNLVRMQGVARSPVYSHVIESLGGLSTIQALSAQANMIRVFDHHQDMHSSINYASLTTGRAFAFSLDVVCVFYIVFVVLSSLENCNAGELGLAITQAIGVTGMLQWGVRQSTEMENLMTSVERIVEYANIDNERSEDPKEKLAPRWLKEGNIKFDKVSLWYSPDENTKKILNGIRLNVNPKEKVAIVGRTGSGKSSLVNALFRLAYTDGLIEIDNQDIKKLPFDCLRREISVIPQEPILFSGSLRYNLDPFRVHSDEEIWHVLEAVQLREIVKRPSTGLDKEICEEGSSISTGEKQLLCLARAILRNNKILIMDEATANVDQQTDKLIQTTIRDKFKDCTVVVITHRLETVMDLDRVAVMDNGSIVEYGTPSDLIRNTKSKLYDMAKNAGELTYDQLLNLTRKSSEPKID